MLGPKQTRDHNFINDIPFQHEKNIPPPPAPPDPGPGRHPGPDRPRPPAPHPNPPAATRGKSPRAGRFPQRNGAICQGGQPTGAG